MSRTRKPPERWLPLQTERLVLREFREEDLDDIHAYGSDPEVTRYMIWGPNTPEVSREFLERKLDEQKIWPRSAVSVALALAGGSRMIGAAEIRMFDAGPRTGEIGYTLARPYWRQGYASEVAEALLRQGFEAMGMRRIIATCEVANTGSWRVMEKLGMRREGCFRQDVKVGRRWRDSYHYALLATEWRARRAAVAPSST